jgi:hypothetical protein
MCNVANQVLKTAAVSSVTTFTTFVTFVQILRQHHLWNPEVIRNLFKYLIICNNVQGVEFMFNATLTMLQDTDFFTDLYKECLEHNWITSPGIVELFDWDERVVLSPYDYTHLVRHQNYNVVRFYLEEDVPCVGDIHPYIQPNDTAMILLLLGGGCILEGAATFFYLRDDMVCFRFLAGAASAHTIADLITDGATDEGSGPLQIIEKTCPGVLERLTRSEWMLVIQSALDKFDLLTLLEIESRIGPLRSYTVLDNHNLSHLRKCVHNAVTQQRWPFVQWYIQHNLPIGSKTISSMATLNNWDMLKMIAKRRVYDLPREVRNLLV